MAQKKPITKSKKTVVAVQRNAANGKSANKSPASKSRHNGSGQTANDLTLIAWKQTYAKRDRFGKFD
jgi:hypothetical protein